jgi:tRNA A-37 threonylcarbamoyl transferase component Bud32/tetratricopeptide (TPR) repeat protein
LGGAGIGATDIAPTVIPVAETIAGHTGADANVSAPLEVGTSFGPRYHIIRVLGAGGMGAVYQAWDAELGVAVAIKVIRPEALTDPAVAADIERRFKNELLLARQVTHKNVVRIHDIGQIDGIKYITMPYIDGVDLATVVKRDGRLPIDHVLTIARSVVSGLAAAHAAGVVHRDLKPANIMLPRDGHALLMDFGIARSTGEASRHHAADLKVRPTTSALSRAAAGVDATMAGTIVGTVEYMAPEQARGEAVDQRADLYAFGLILYDLLTGRARQHPDGSVAELQARMVEAPPSLRKAAPEVPEPLARLVTRCIEPDPAARFQSAAEVAAALDRLDARGQLIPLKRTVRLPVVAALVVFLLAASGLGWWFTRGVAPAAPREPVSVLIADFQNTTGDPAFDRVLEPMLRRALEGAGFITAYDRAAIGRTLGVQPPVVLGEVQARELAVQQGLGVVVSGSIQPVARVGGYRVSVKATRTVSDELLTSAEARAGNKDEVLEAATGLMANVRTALGDEATDAEQMFAMSSLTTASLDVVARYAAAQEAMSNARFDEARQRALEAVALDPKFGIGYQLLSIASRNLGLIQDSEKYIREALQQIDNMTERERFATRGMFYRVTGDYKNCVKEYGDLVARFAADVAAHNQIALCSSQLRDLRTAVSEMRLVVDILPQRLLFRDNLALYSNYAGDFAAAEEVVKAIAEPDAYGVLALAFAQIAQDRPAEARASYTRLASMGVRGASLAASGLGDLAAYEQRYDEAVRLLEEGAAADLVQKAGDSAAAKLAAVAAVQLQQGERTAAVAAAERALAHSQAVKIRFLAARTFVEAGVVIRARPLVDGLAREPQPEPKAYAKIVEGLMALAAKDAPRAIALITEANGLLDTWIGRFDLGRAYVAARQFTQADSEFDRCFKRRGEALALFLDEEPTFAYLPAVSVWQSRAREELKATSGP